MKPDWWTDTVAAIALGVVADAAADRLPVLADALEDAGWEPGRYAGSPTLLGLRNSSLYALGCLLRELAFACDLEQYRRGGRGEAEPAEPAQPPAPTGYFWVHAVAKNSSLHVVGPPPQAYLLRTLCGRPIAGPLGPPVVGEFDWEGEPSIHYHGAGLGVRCQRCVTGFNERSGD